MKRVLSILALVLAAACVLMCFAACDTNPGDNSGSVNESSDASVSGTTSDPDEVSTYRADIPDKKYDDRIFNIYSFTYDRGSAGYSHFGNGGDGVELEANVVNDAILTRNYYVEDQLGVKIVETVDGCNERSVGAAYNRLTNMMDANVETFDLLCPSMYCAVALSENGYLQNLLDFDYLHGLEAPWWDQFFVDDITINDRLDFVTGDMCMYARTGIFVNFFNKELFEQYTLENPYQLVREKKWTIDKVYEMSKSMAEELNNDGVIDYNDLYGFGGQDDTMTFWFYSFGGRIVSKDADGSLAITMYNEQTTNYVEKLREFMLDDTCYVSANDYFNVTGYKQTPTEYIFDAFATNHSLFMNVDLVFIKQVGDIKADFGVLPSPLYDENQEEYMQALNCWNAQPVCIPSYISDEESEFASIVTEALGAATKNIVTPAFYETTLQQQKTRDDDSIEMLDIIFNGIGADLAHVYNWNSVGFALNQLVTNTTLEFTSFYQSIESGVKVAIDKTVEAYKD